MADFVQRVPAKRGRMTLKEQRGVYLPLQQHEELLHAFECLQMSLTELTATERELRADHAALVTRQEMLCAELQGYQQVLDLVADGYLMTDTHGTIQAANRSAARLLNIPQQFLPGKALASFVAADEWHEFQSNLIRLRHVDTAQEWRMQFQPHNQPPVEVQLMVVTICNQDDQVVALHWLLRERGEEQMQRLQATLERRVVERIAQFEAARHPVAEPGAYPTGAIEPQPVGQVNPGHEPDVNLWASSRLPSQHMIKNRFIYNLLHGLVDDEMAILRDARLLGLDFSPPRAVILIAAADYILAPLHTTPGEAADAQIRHRAEAVISSVVSFFHLPNDTICAYLGDGQVAVLKASDTKNLVSWVEQQDAPAASNSASSWANLTALKRAGNALLRHVRQDIGAAISIGIGRYHPGIRELTRSYADARAALSLGHRFHGPNGVYCLDGLGIAAFVGVSDEQTKIDLAKHLLSPLTHAPELIETLTVFFAQNCVPSDTAAALSIHRNTLSYRLDKITALTGLNPRNFDDAVQVRLALALRHLQHQVS